MKHRARINDNYSLLVSCCGIAKHFSVVCVCGIVVFIKVDFECATTLNCFSCGRVRVPACFLEDGHALSDCC